MKNVTKTIGGCTVEILIIVLVIVLAYIAALVSPFNPALDRIRREDADDAAHQHRAEEAARRIEESNCNVCVHKESP